MKINIFRHKSKDGYLLLAVEWDEDISSDLQNLMALNNDISDTDIEGQNIIAFKIAEIDNVPEKDIKTNILNVVRTYIDSRETLTSVYQEGGDEYGEDTYSEIYEEAEMIQIPRDQFQFLAAETTELRIANAVLQEANKGALEHIALLRVSLGLSSLVAMILSVAMITAGAFLLYRVL